MTPANPPEESVIRIAAAVIADPDGRVLLVRKRGSRIFMQAGGKIEPGESPAEALRRELREELLLDLGAGVAEPLGRFAARAAHEAGHRVEAEVFALRIDRPVRPAAEIEEIVWVDPFDLPPIEIAELSRDHIMPALRAGWGRR
ncbi:NUDIX hydrolase [Prosthecomicrobium hirschii]|uniref:NUDIX hydrolase n=1 Tax=Prosthecodimorpha hirschii TaxID=665126 RepID=UPI0022200C08|nr:NUDIX domain-containing protein [Prosthecomicrobium hirschii]MCW1840208.1 NUDIX domain-containing protein [Prosthecomicrobium hirschii]